jgi:hypothetical protein|tara:strand:+ start:1605 stop:2225 length:621 start_codon:yes stop_codon:yes gene_type:complete
MALTVPFTFSAGTDILSAQVNSNFAQVLNGVDKRGDALTGNLTASAGVTVDGVDISAVVGAGGTLLAVNGAAVTALNGTAVASGTVAVARLGSGSPGSGNYLRGDGAWTAIPDTITFVASGSGTIAVTASNGVTQFINCTGTSTVNLFAASGKTGYTVHVKLTSASATVTIDGNASETIDGATTQAFSQRYQTLSMVCDGSNWHII